VLGTYYLAQSLIVFNLLRDRAPAYTTPPTR
jgi:hypothetical protein